MKEQDYESIKDEIELERILPPQLSHASAIAYYLTRVKDVLKALKGDKDDEPVICPKCKDNKWNFITVYKKSYSANCCSCGYKNKIVKTKSKKLVDKRCLS